MELLFQWGRQMTRWISENSGGYTAMSAKQKNKVGRRMGNEEGAVILAPLKASPISDI